MAANPRCSTLLFASVSLFILQRSFADESSGILDQCKESCERSYPLHTYPKEEPSLACKQGCRLSAIAQLKAGYSNSENFTQVCATGCQESYEDSESLYACVFGCKSQIIPSPDTFLEERMPDQWSFRTYMVYVYPVLDVSKYCRGFMNRVGYYYRMSTSYYYSYGDSNGVRIIEINEPPQQFISIQKFDEVDFVENDDPQDSSDSDDTDDSYSSAVVKRGHQWLECVSQRSGLPIWLLTSTLFLSIFFLIWLCCATATTTRKEKAKAAVVGELMFLDHDSLLEKMPLVKADEKDDAGPLPVKLHIDATVL